MAEFVNNETPFIDVSMFRYSRFAENDLFFEPCCI
jgi:sarcosine oxidase subunit beta